MTNQAIESGDLRVAFQWRGDRYGHTIEKRSEGEWQVLLETVEGSPADDWPASPVLQSLHIEARHAGPVALLVGKAGSSHWSASIEPLLSQQSLQFDIACRVHQPPQRLGATYRLAHSSAHRIVQISATPHEGNCKWVEQPEIRVWQIRPTGAGGDYTCTIRWRYTLSASV